MPAINKIHIAMGLLAVAIGTLPLLSAVGILPSRPPAPGDAPVWIAAAIGLAFFLAGVVAIVQSFASAGGSGGELSATAPRTLRAVYDLMVTAIPVALAALFSWVAFGPGERHFSVSGGSGGTAGAMSASGGGDMIGRMAFGMGAFVAWFLVGRMMLTMARRWFPRR